MNDAVYKLSLDIHEHASQAVLKAKKTDTGRKLHITLRAGGTPYTIANDCEAVFKATKPDRTALFNNCTIENNEIIYEFTEETCTSVGRCKCEIALFGPDGKIITSPRFSLLVDGTIYPDDIVESTDEFSELTKLITGALEATNAATQAAQKADQAANDANEAINKYGDHPIKFIDNTSGEVKTVLHELPEGAYMLTGFFPYTREHDEEGIYFSNDLVSVEKYEAEDSVVVQFLVGRYLNSANISSNHVDYEKIPLRNLENKENRVTTIGETSDDEHYPTAKAVYDLVGTLPSQEPESHEKYFDIDVDGLVSLKPEYRGDSTDYYVNTGKYTFSESDRGIGYEGSKISELPEHLVIPDNVNGEMVTGFQIAIFCCNKRIKEVVLPSSVKAISNGMFREAIHLEKVKNTEQIETIGNSAFTYTRIEEIRFPNLATLGKQVFENCSCLRVIDVGKIASIGNTVFKWCENLTDVIGGENVKTIGSHTFFATRRLKRLSFLGNVTRIESAAFYGSRCDISVSSDCTFVGTATYKQFNDTDYWTGVTPTACRNPLNSVFHQRDPRWANTQIGNLVDEKGEPLTYGYQGCALIVLAEIYSAFEKDPLIYYPPEGAEPYISPEAFTQILESKGLLLDYRWPINPETGVGWITIAEGLGYTTDFIDTMTTENLKKVYDALTQGALVYRSIAVEKDGALQTNGGHAILAYGINSDGELLTTDTSSRCDSIGIYDNYKTAWHIYKHGDKECNVVIVKKQKEE